MSNTKTAMATAVDDAPAGTDTRDIRQRVAEDCVDLIDERAVAELLHVTVRAVQNLRWYGGDTRGKLGWYRIGKRVLYDRGEVIAWRAAQRVTR